MLKRKAKQPFYGNDIRERSVSYTQYMSAKMQCSNIPLC